MLLMSTVSYGKFTIEIPVRVKLFIDGEEVSSSKGKTFTRENPAQFDQTIALLRRPPRMTLTGLLTWLGRYLIRISMVGSRIIGRDSGFYIKRLRYLGMRPRG